MKIKNQTSMPSKYWLVILAVICVGLLGIEAVSDVLSGLWQIIPLFPCRRASVMRAGI